VQYKFEPLNTLAAIFSTIEDPRDNRGKRHKLPTIRWTTSSTLQAASYMSISDILLRRSFCLLKSWQDSSALSWCFSKYSIAFFGTVTPPTVFASK